MVSQTFPSATDGASPVSIRASYLKFPGWTQPIWTWLTGKPLPHQRATFRLRPALCLVVDLVTAILSTCIHLRLLCAPDAAGRLLGYALTPAFAFYLTGVLRKAQVVYGHHAIHGTLFKGRKKLNDYAAMILTILSLSQNEREYERDHLDHHRRSVFTTLRDADACLLHRFGLRPGKPMNALMRTLLLTLVSPKYHLVLLQARLSSNLRRPTFGLILLTAWIVFVFGVLPAQVGVVPMALAVWLPMSILYQMSALLQFATEHVWLTGEAPNANRVYAERCHGRFCGERVPGTDGSPATAHAWIKWWTRTVLMHAPIRVAVLVGDLPAHDWHHLVPIIEHSYSDWPIAIYERQRAIDSGNSAAMEARECWGIDNMIRHVLLSMAAAPPLADGRDEVPQPPTMANSP